MLWHPASGATGLGHLPARVLEQPVVVRLGRIVFGLIALAECRVQHAAAVYDLSQVGQAPPYVLYRQVREERVRPGDVRPRRQP
ncbi:MAG: hypothetical protein K8E66_08845, partial [Phycisphaerales bacterium]|nr:hypothetical protein [Phycisphaerales bacterium]